MYFNSFSNTSGVPEIDEGEEFVGPVDKVIELMGMFNNGWLVPFVACKAGLVFLGLDLKAASWFADVEAAR